MPGRICLIVCTDQLCLSLIANRNQKSETDPKTSFNSDEELCFFFTFYSIPTANNDIKYFLTPFSLIFAVSFAR